MILDPYATCPCGSGKKFKWCCQPIHVEIDRAFRQDEQGQHEAALRAMDQIIRDHGDNPEAWGRKAELLYRNDKVEEAEAALDRALSLNPRYPFGYLLRGLFRYHEGEIPGSLLLFRKAADAYDPQARDLLAQVYGLIADCELKLNRPVAARAALRLSVDSHPGDGQGREQFDALFGEKSRLPRAARREYTFAAPAPTAGGDRRVAWDRALQGVGEARLSAAVGVFDELTRADPQDAAAWYNLGLARAWLGDNAAALEALDQAIALEPDEPRAGEFAALGEVLRCGAGLENQCDYHEHLAIYQVRDLRPVVAQLEEWDRARRLITVQTEQQEGMFNAIILDAPSMLSGVSTTPQPAPLAAFLMVVQNIVRLSGPAPDRLKRVREELEKKAGAVLGMPELREVAPVLTDLVTEAVVFPVGISDKVDAEEKVRKHAEQFFEGEWLQRPRRSLNGINPLDASGHPVLRKKLRGVVTLLQEAAAGGALAGYDFNRLRRKLGLDDADPGSAAPGGSSAGDIPSLGVPGLAALAVETLEIPRLEQALQAAQRLDAHDLGRRFAQALTARTEPGDRHGAFAYLIQRALADGDTTAALDLVNEGEKADCERNEGRRRDEYELRRGQLHARRGEADAAVDVFERLIQRDPGNVKARGAAAEAMLSLKQPARALRFAEEGLAEARRRNDRDSEGYLMDLVGAAKRQGA